tara:strand:+ start:545 stop:1363 length:819 start_codon:yes stop_codon:yes gene_type:complete
MRDKFLVLDGHGLIYRAIFRPGPPLTAPNGEPTRGTYTFCATLFALIESLQPTYLALADDAPRKSTFRRRIWPQYKANRERDAEGPPAEIVVQTARCKQIVKALGIPVIGAPTFEADDIIASLVEVCASDEVEVVIGSRDKDLHQLVGDACRLYDPADREWWDVERVEAKWGVRVDQIAEMQALMGDPTDNVPGIKGVGEKRARDAIIQHGTAAAFAEQAGHDLDHVALMRELVTLRRDVPLRVSASALEFDGFDMAAARPLFQSLGFTTFV